MNDCVYRARFFIISQCVWKQNIRSMKRPIDSHTHNHNSDHSSSSNSGKEDAPLEMLQMTKKYNIETYLQFIEFTNQSNVITWMTVNDDQNSLKLL